MPLDLEPLELEPVGSKLDLEPLDLEPVSGPRAARRADLQAQQAAARSAGETTSFSARAAAGIEQGLRTPEAMVRGGLDALQYYRALDAVTGSGDRFQRQNEAELRAMRDRDAFLARETQAIEGRDGRNFVGDLVQGVARGVVELPPQLMAGAAGAMRGAAVQASAAMGGVQGGLSQFAQERGEGRSQLEALPPAVASGLITAVTTRAFGDTGIESVFRNEGTQGFRRRLLGVLKDAGMEGAEEFVDQAQQDLLERVTRNPGKPLGESFYDTMQALAVGTVIGGAATAPRLIQRGNRPVIVNEQTGTTDFPPLEGDELPPPPPPPPPADPANVPPPIRGEAAMETRPSASWTPDGPRTPAVDPELADAIAAIRAGYNPEVDAPTPAPALPSTFNLQPSTLPDVPGVPPPLEGQPYDTALRTRPEATMETRPAAPIGLQREPTVSPELADAIAAVRGGYNPEIDAAAPEPAPTVEQEQLKWERKGVKYAKRPDGSLKTKAEYTPDEWRAYTSSVIDAKLADSTSPTAPAPKTPRDQSGGPAKLTPPAKAAVDELSKLRQQAKELDAKIQKSKSGTEANRKRLAEWMRLTAQIAKLETGQTAAATVKPAEVPIEIGDTALYVDPSRPNKPPVKVAISSIRQLPNDAEMMAEFDYFGPKRVPVSKLKLHDKSQAFKMREMAKRNKAADAATRAQPTPPDQSGAPTELTPPAKGKRKAKAKAPEVSPAQPGEQPQSAAVLSPMMQQYQSIKRQLPDGTLLAFRLGDFYEFFFEDAGQAAETLQVALTKRRDVPMAGIPYHMARSSFEKLVGSGYKVAVVDQVGEAKPGKPVERKVTEVISASQPTAPTELTPPAKGTAEPLSPTEVSEFNALEQARRAGTLDAAGATRYRELETRAGQGDLLMPAPPPLTPANVPTAAKVTPAQASRAANPKTEFNAKVAKEQKKFLLDAVDKALAEAPDTSPQEIQALWRASEHFAAKQKLEDYTKANPYPTAPNRYEFGFTDEEVAKFEAAKQAHALAIAEWEQRRDAELAPLAASYVSEIPFLTGKEHQGSTTELALRFGAEAAFMRSLPHVTIEVPGDGVFSIINTKDAIREFKERAAKFPTTAARAKAPTQARTGPSPVPALGELTKENVLNAAALAMSTDPDRAIINTVWSDGQQTVATDGRRLHWFAKGIGGTVKKPAIVDAKGKPVTNLDRDYPNWQQVRPDKAEMEVVFTGQDAGKLWTVLKQAQQMVEEKNNSIMLWWNRDRTLGISSASPDAGTYEHNVQPKAKIMTALDPQYVMDALAAARGTGSERVDILWKDNMSPVVIQAPGFEAVIMPMRLSGPSPIFDPEMLTRYDLAATPETRRAMMKKDLAAIQRLGRPTGTEEVKAKWLKEQLGEVEDFAAEIARLEAKRKKEAAKPRTTAQKAAAQQRINAELQAEIDRLKALQNASSPSAVDSAIAALEAAKVKPGGLYALPDLGLTVTLWNGTLTAAQVALRAGRTLAQAVQAGVDWLRAQGQAFDEGEVRQALEQGLLQAPGIREHVGKRLLQEDFSPAAKAALEPLLRYEVKPDAQLFAEAAAVVEAIGPMEAEANYFGNPWGLPADAHVVLGFAIGNGLSTLEAQARAAGDTALADRIGRQNAEFQSQFVLQSTETARTLRAYRYFDLVANLSPFTADLFARKVIEQASQKQKQRLKPTLDAAQQQLTDINRTGINEAARTPEVQGAARTAINQAIEEEARTAGTPIQQAIAAEVVAQLQTAGRLNAVEAAIVREHFGQNPEPLALADKLERAGVKPAKARAAELEGKYKDGVEAFRAKLRQKLAEARKKDIDPATLGIVDKAIRQRLAELQVKLGALVRQHWTEQERVGRTLAESLVQEAGLPEAQATRLADAIQRRFKALVQARKEQALRNLAKTPAARELQKPSVAQRIIEATNLGALDSEGLWQAVADKLGLPTYSDEASAEVKRLADRAQQLPEGSVQRRKATADMMNYIARRKGVKRGDLAWAFWYGNVLSDPRTWAVNFGDTGLNALASTAAVFTTEPGGVPQAIRQVPRAVGKGMAEAREVWRTGQDLRTHKEGDLSAPVLALYDRKAGFGPMMAWLYSNVGKVMTATDVFWQQATREMKAVQLARIMAKEEGLTGNTLRLRVEEILNNTTERRGQLEAQLQREAAQMRAAGMEPDALWEQRRIYQLEEELRGPELEARANDFAARTAYNNEPYGVMGAVTNAIELGTRAMEAQAAKTGNERTAALASLARRFVIPFTRIPANAWNERLNYTPLGLARGTWAVLRARVMPDGQQRLYGREVQPGDVAEVLVKGAAGTLAMATMVLAGLKALDDDEGWQIHGAGPRNSDHRKTLRGTGWIPFSFQKGDKFVSFANTPFAAAFAMVGNYVDRHRYKDTDADGALNEARLAAMGAVQVFEQQTYIDAVARTLGLLDNVNDKTPVRMAEVLGRGSASFVPVAGANVLRGVDRADDPKVYQAKTVSDALLFGFPFVRRIGQPALNEFGEPVTLNPMARFYTARKEDVLVDLVRRGIYPTKPNKAVNRLGREMTDDEHYRYVQESGQAIKRRLETPGMRQMIRSGKEEDARKAVTAIVREERERARRRLGF